MAPRDQRCLASDIAVLVDAHGRYPNHEEGFFYDEVLHEVQAAAELSGSVGKRDIGALMLWKRLNLSVRWTRALNELSDHHVRTITASALELARDSTRPIPDAARSAREALLSLPGCGPSGQAIPSTILTACAPNRMSVYDARAVDALRQLRYSGRIDHYRQYMTVVCSIVDEANEARGLNWHPHDVDKALFIMGSRKPTPPEAAG